MKNNSDLHRTIIENMLDTIVKLSRAQDPASHCDDLRMAVQTYATFTEALAAARSQPSWAARARDKMAVNDRLNALEAQVKAMAAVVDTA